MTIKQDLEHGGKILSILICFLIYFIFHIIFFCLELQGINKKNVYLNIFASSMWFAIALVSLVFSIVLFIFGTFICDNLRYIFNSSTGKPTITEDEFNHWYW